MTFSLRYAARSETGLVRSTNQDSAYAGPNLVLVADGMGGHAGGDIASRIVVEHMRYLDQPGHTAASAPQDLDDAIELARLGLVGTSAANPQFRGMGTTITALLHAGDALVLAHMGDSRAYLLRDGELTQVTTDHTFVQTLVDAGKITPAEALIHPQRNVVMRVLSDFDLDLHPDISLVDALPGDRWLLCSDGLSGFVDEALLLDVLTEFEKPDAAVDALISAAIDGRSTDNITALVADVVPNDDVAPVSELEDLNAAEPNPPMCPADSEVYVVGAAASNAPLPALPVAWHDDGSDGLESFETFPQPELHPAGLALATSAAGLDELGETDYPVLFFDDDPDAAPPPRRRPLRALIVGLLVLAAVVGGALGGYRWTQSQYFVGISDNRVAVFRGVNANIGAFELFTPIELLDTSIDELPALFVTRLQETIRATSRDDALSRALRLIEQADEVSGEARP